MVPLNDQEKECLHVIKTMSDWFTRMERRAGRYGDMCPWHDRVSCLQCKFHEGTDICLFVKAARMAGHFLSHERLSAEDSEIQEGRRILDL